MDIHNPTIIYYSSWYDVVGVWKPNDVRTAACRGASEDKLICDELRERDCNEATLPFETMLPSGSLGELGTNDVAVPFGSS